MANTLVTLFQNSTDAQTVMRELTEAGFGSKDVNILGKGTKGGTKNITTTLTSAGVPKATADVYEESVQQGGTLVTLRVDDNEVDKAMSIIERHNAVDMNDRLSKVQTGSATDTGRARGAVQGEAAIPVIEEQLQVGKRQVERGGVRIYSHVSERPVEEQVRLREEHVRVERHPVDRPVSEADMARLREGTIEVTEMAEEAVVQKSARVVEEVIVGKDVQELTQTVRDTVRRTDVEVEQVDEETSRKNRKR